MSDYFDIDFIVPNSNYMELLPRIRPYTVSDKCFSNEPLKFLKMNRLSWDESLKNIITENNASTIAN